MNDPDRIVSSEGEELILVDLDDNEIGFRSKADCHAGAGIRHRAFSLFLFNEDGELLLQKRSRQKRLWPGFWSNSCCSHPRRGETLETATQRRLSDELNISAQLEHIYHFCYQADFASSGAENELCHVYLGRVLGEVRPNSSEVEAVRLISAMELDREFERRPKDFTPWFKQEWRRLNTDFREQLGRYAI